MNTLANTFSALGDSHRLAIVEKLLKEGELCAGELNQSSTISPPAMSRHLKVLREAGIVTRRIDKQRRVFSVRAEAVQQICAWTLNHREFWEGSLDRLADALGEGKQKMTDLVIEREFSSSVDVVFDFITKHESLLQWWGPEFMDVEGDSLDFSRLGPWESVMTNKDGKKFKVSGDVIEIQPNSFVDISWGWHDEHDDRGHNSRVRFELSSTDSGGTMLKLVHTGLPDEEAKNNHQDGWMSTFRKLQGKLK